MRKTIFVKQKFLILTSIIVILIVFVLGRSFIGKINTRTNDESKDKTTLIKDEPKIEAGCNRNVRLENEPKFDRALSLVYEKIGKLQKDLGDASSLIFPPQLVNCVQVKKSDLPNAKGIEGFFVFNDKDIKPNNFPISVDRKYDEADDLVNALLLTHEITHVHQYINTLNGTDTLSCIDKEVNAFYSQLLFTTELNEEEGKSLDLRIENDQKLHPQLQIIDSMRSLRDPGIFSKCLLGKTTPDPECASRDMKNKIKGLVLQDDYYKDQCKSE